MQLGIAVSPVAQGFAPQLNQAANQMRSSQPVLDDAGASANSNNLNVDTLASDQLASEKTAAKKSTVSLSGQSSATTENAENNSDTTSPKQSKLLNQLTEQEQKQLKSLVSRDREVRAHEQAHANVGGRYAGSPTYTFQRGPDGRQYAIGGEVAIDISPVAGDPEATIEKARIIRRAALAPAEPSAQDRAVAAEASVIEQQAKVELLQYKNNQRLADQSDASQQGGRGQDNESNIIDAFV